MRFHCSHGIQSGDFPTNKKRVTVASGRPCNTYWSAPLWTLPALPKTWQRLTASPSAVPSIGRAPFDEHTTPGGKARMMMMTESKLMIRYFGRGNDK